MSKLVLTDLANLQTEQTAVSSLNNNNSSLETAFDNTLSRDGTAPNFMNAELDMNSNRIINIPIPSSALEPVRYDQFLDSVLGLIGTAFIPPLIINYAPYQPSSGTVDVGTILRLNRIYDDAGDTAAIDFGDNTANGIARIAAVKTSAGEGEIIFSAQTGGGNGLANSVFGIQGNGVVNIRNGSQGGAFAALDNADVIRRILSVENNGLASNATRLRSAGGGVSIENVSGTTLVGVLENGRVGVGTNTPSQVFDTVGGIATVFEGSGGGFFSDNNVGTDKLILSLGNNGLGGNVTRLVSAGDAISFEDAARNTKMTMTNAGLFGIGIAPPTVMFEVKGASTATYFNAITGNPTLSKIYQGGDTAPLNTTTPMVGISRTEAFTGDPNATIGGQNSALYVASVGLAAQYGQVNAVVGNAYNSGKADAVAGYFSAEHRGTAIDGVTSSVAYGLFAASNATTTGTSAFSIQCNVNNGTGDNRPYTPGAANSYFVGGDFNYSTTTGNYGGMGVLIRSSTGNASGSNWDVGLLISAGYTAKTASIRDDSNSPTAYLLKGTHTTGFDLTTATISGNAFTSVGFTLGNSGAISAASLALTTSPLAISSGGTGATTAVSAFNGLSPSTTLGDLIYHNGTDDIRLAGNITSTKKFLRQTGNGSISAAPAWDTVVAADIPGSALTKTDDTNVTLTLGGSPTTALLNAASITVGWTGTLAAARLNSNVVQAVTNDTNVTGSVATQTLTLGWTGQLGLTRGGTAASLTASNGGIVYSTASAMAILSGTATANQMLLSGASGAPSWSTVTHPATTTINQILYSSAANVISGLATANSGVLITSAGGVPSISSTIPTATQDNITRTGTLVSGATGAGFTVALGTSTITGTLGVTNGGTGDTGTAWTSWTPTVTAGGGTLTTVTALTSRSKTLGKTVFVEYAATFTDIGTATGFIRITLPSTSASRGAFAAINASNKNACVGLLDTGVNYVDIYKYDGAIPVASGSTLVFTGTYEST